MKKSIILRTEINVFGYADEVEFRQTEESGAVRYDIYYKERWADGHITYPTYSHRRFKTADEGNKVFMEALADGYKRI